jgi:hypothetical protein
MEFANAFKSQADVQQGYFSASLVSHIASGLDVGGDLLEHARDGRITIAGF